MRKILFLLLIGGLIFTSSAASQTRWMRLHPDVSWRYLERWEKEHQWLTPARAGRLHFQKHEVGRARQLLEEAVKEGAGDGRLLYELGYSCRLQGDDEAALGYLRQAAQALARDNPGHLYHFNALYLSGIILEESGDEEEALALYSSALELRPEISALRHRRAYLLARKGESSAARKEIGRLLEQEPESGTALYLAGLLALEDEDYSTAETYLERALQAGFDPAPTHYALGRLAALRDDPARAFRQYESALAADPHHRDALIAVANLSYREDDLERAREYFGLLSELEPDRARWHYNLGVIYRDLGLSDLSRRSLDEARRLDPDILSSSRRAGEDSELLARAGERLEAGEYREAAQLYRQSLAEDPFFIPAHFNLAVAYRRTRQGRRSLRQYERLLRIEPDYSPARLNAGIIAVELKDRPSGALHLRRYLNLEPDSPQADLARRYLRDMRGW